MLSPQSDMRKSFRLCFFFFPIKFEDIFLYEHFSFYYFHVRTRKQNLPTKYIPKLLIYMLKYSVKAFHITLLKMVSDTLKMTQG